jgi:hypothetical protein
MRKRLVSAGWYAAYVGLVSFCVVLPARAQGSCDYWWEGNCSSLSAGWECYDDCYCITDSYCYTPNQGVCPGTVGSCCEQYSRLWGKLSSYGDCNEICDFATNRSCAIDA